ncbi:RDD family protein [Candidatus Woesearchaeota archaeon]|nr:RDD family protein [Candidatus Woesearchaeota archaeon]
MDLNLPEKSVFYGPANLWKRMLAFLLDIFVLDFFVLSIFSGMAEMVVGNTKDVLLVYKMLQQDTSQVQALTMIFTIIIMLALAYFVLLQYAVGQTAGCMLLNIYVVAQTGENKFGMPSLLQSFVRNMFIIPTIPFILLWIADPVFLFFGKRGQRLTEWLSTTMVIEKFEM